MLLQRLIKMDIPREELDAVVSDLAKHFLNFCQPEAIVLFGSGARGDLHLNSDLDLAFIFANEVIASQMQKTLPLKMPKSSWPLDLICLDSVIYHRKKNIGGLCMLIKRDGRLIYSVEGFVL